MQAVAGTGLASLAGCSGPGGEGSSDGGVDPVQDRVEVDPSDIQEGGTFRTAIGTNPDSFDTAYSSEAAATTVQDLLYEGLITTDASGELYPWLAESYEQVEVQDLGPADYTDYMRTVEYTESEGRVFIDIEPQIVVEDPDNPDEPSAGDEARVLTVEEAPDAVADGTFGMHFQFQLHEGITFHNGEELTAQNVVESYARLENSPLAGQYFDSLLHVAADGDYTVNLYAQEPDAAAVRELAGFDIYPSETATLDAGAMDPREGNTPLGTGPFTLAEFQNEEFLIFERYDDYWFDTEMKDWFDGPSDFPNGPVVDKVDVSVILEDAQRSAALQEGELDMAYGLSSSTLTNYRESEDYRTAPTDGAGYTFLQFPVRQAPWDNAKLRQAANKLIPRQQISDNIFNGWESPAWVPLPPVAAATGTTDYEALVEENRSFNEYEPSAAAEMAQEVVDEQGIETPIEVTLETNSENSDRVKTVELIAESMSQEIDGTQYFDVTVNTKEFTTFVQELLGANYWKQGKLAFIGLSGGFDAHGYAKAVHHPDNFMGCCNFQNIDIQRLNEALREARYSVDVTQDQELRQERYEEIWKIILEENANSYGTHSTTVGVVANNVKGFNTYPSVQAIIGYGLYNPADEQITYLEQ